MARAGIDVLIIHSDEHLSQPQIKAPNVKYIHVSLKHMAKRLAAMFDGVPIEGKRCMHEDTCNITTYK